MHSSPSHPGETVLGSRSLADRLLSREAMGFLALGALGMSLQVIVFGVPAAVHEVIRLVQIAVFVVFVCEYFYRLLKAPDRWKFVLRPSRLFDFSILFVVTLSFLPYVEDRLLNAQGLQVLRLLPIFFFGYVGTREFSAPLFEEGRPAAETLAQFFRVETEGPHGRNIPIPQSEALSWLGNTGREGLIVCRGNVPDELATALSSAKIPPSMLKNALSESSFPRSLKVGNLYVFAGAVPLTNTENRSMGVVRRVSFVAVFTRQSILLVNSSGMELSDQLLHLIHDEHILEGQPLAHRCLGGLFKLVMDHYEACAMELELMIRSAEYEPLDRSGKSIYRNLYLIRRALSNLKSDLWRLRHILHAIEEKRRATIFDDGLYTEFFALLCHAADFLHETFGELDEKASALLDLRINMVSFEMNRFMGLLAVVTAIGLIPATLSGLLGMNIDGINFPISLGNVVFLSGILILMVLYVMRVRGWLRFR